MNRSLRRHLSLSLSILGLALGGGTSRATEAVAPGATVEDASPAMIEIGRRMYLEGALPSGEPLHAVVQGDVPVSGEQVTCVGCHRRSGLSFSEAGRFVPPIAGRFLYQPKEVRRKELWATRTQGPGTRPAYTDATLMRAIRAGIDPAGRPLDPLMPRFQLSDEALRPLIAYLKTLSTDLPPGITDEAMHFATIVGEGVDPEQRRAMLDVLETYFHDKNNETRHESGRAARAPWHKDWVYQAYRKWVLHVWELTGSEETWAAQLEAYYREQPVFAVLSGIADGDWAPVHAFCETQAVPCLFPNTDRPVIDEEDFYTLYFTKGLSLEAQALARHLADPVQAPAGPIVQVYRDESRGRSVARAFRDAWLAVAQGREIVDRPLLPAAALDAGFWASLLTEDRPGVLVLWLDRADLAGLAPLGEVSDLTALYLSAGLLGVHDGNLPELPQTLGEKAFLTFPYALPEAQDALLVRPRAWLRAKGLSPSDERIQANTHFAVMLTGAAIRHIIDNFSREYLIERIEHRVDDALTSSLYPRVSLAPGQRFASKGCYIARWPTGNGEGLTPDGDWIIP